MPRPRTEDKRKRILEAAVKVFARKGYFAARVSEIAKKAGVADGTIYLYFRNKEDILVKLFDEVMAEHVQQVRAAVRALPTTKERLTWTGWGAIATWRWSSRWSCGSPPSSWSASPPPGCRTTSPS